MAYHHINTKKIDTNVNQTDLKQLKEKTDQFEAVLVKQWLDIALKHENPLFGKDPSDKIYHSMFNDEVSRTGQGSFGFSKLLFDHLSGDQGKPNI
jgi:hypothetical protein